ncbi:MAG: sulfatase-like hydrolase/transferase [Anaerolineae bacterium]|nr:sulfatase-like hydrolase/transferase [Anaerolineae bacterium]
MTIADRPNLLFLMTDHQRADSLGMVQSGAEVTPNLNRLAGAGTRFTRAYTTCPLCVPARTALATGKYPTKNGVVFNDWQGVRAGDHMPLHQMLFEAGYSVGHIGVDHIRVAPSLRERISFASWYNSHDYVTYVSNLATVRASDDVSSFRRPVTENQGGRRLPVKYSNTLTAVWPFPAEHFLDAYYGRQACEFISQPHPQPFALFLYLWAPHPPLRVPEPYASRFNPDSLDLPANVGHRTAEEPPGRRNGIAAQLAEGVSQEAWRRVWAAHLGLVNMADEIIGEVLASVDQAGLSDDTVICFTADHGDHLGQHVMYQKMEMYEPAINIPLIMKGPGIHAQVVDGVVSHLDILPTLTNYLHLKALPDIDGISQAETLTNGTPPAEERMIFAQYSGNPTVGDIRRAIVTQRHKAIFDPVDQPELFDLEHDPLEMHNLAGNADCQDQLEELKRACQSWAQAHNDWVTL